MPLRTVQLSNRGRAAALVTSLACGALLLVAASLRPDQSGHATHRQLGLPPCGWVVAFDAPCPTCGMTTAFAHAAAGDPLASFFTQPFGALLAILTAATLIGGLHAAATGIRVDRLLRPLRGKWLLIAGGASILAAWVYKMMTWN